jgi:serine/threonine protein kinase
VVREIGEPANRWPKNSLYLQQDPSGNIVQRIVVKTTQIPHNMWTEAKRWHVDSLNPTKAEHMEIKVMEQIANVDGNHKCVRLEHYTTDRPTFSYRLYMGYHPHGNLVQFTKDRSFYNNRRKIPEPVLWKWFEDLTEAGLLMSTGAEPGVDAKVGWKKIVHCDFKPLNVFLDTSDAKRWRSYPQAIVGDFGESVFTDEKDPFNPTWYNAQYGNSTQTYA